VGPRTGLDAMEKIQIFPLLGIKPRGPARSPSLYRLRYYGNSVRNKSYVNIPAYPNKIVDYGDFDIKYNVLRTAQTGFDPQRGISEFFLLRQPLKNNVYNYVPLYVTFKKYICIPYGSRNKQ
jgi:hypothetical protein